MSRDGWSHGKKFAIGLLGPMLVVRDGVRKELPRSRKTRAVLAYLAMSSGPCRREDLCNLLWEGAEDPRGELRWSLAKIRAAIGDYLQTNSNEIWLSCDKNLIDAVSFRILAEETLTEPKIESALAMWRGPAALVDVEVRGQPAFQAWLAGEQDALAALRTNLLKAAVDRAWSRPKEALSAARRFVACQPWDEWGHTRVAQLLERCGRGAEATAYRASIREELSQELGIPKEQLLRSAAPQNAAASGRPSMLRPGRYAVRIENVKVIPQTTDLTGLASQVIDSLRVGMWSVRSCDILDEDAQCAQRSNGAQPDFAIRGSIVRWGEITQLTLRCVNLRTGSIVWSGQIELQPPLNRAVPNWIKSAVDAMSASLNSASLSATEYRTYRERILAARLLSSVLRAEENAKALDLLHGVLTEEGEDPYSLALAARCYAQRAVYNWSSDPDQERREAKYCASAATRAAMAEPECLTTIATARMLIGDMNGAEVLLDRAMRLDGRLPDTHVRTGWLANYMDDPVRALRHFRVAVKLAPLDPGHFNALVGLGVAHFIHGDYSSAIRAMEQALALNPKATWIYRNLVPAYAGVGNRKLAEAGTQVLMEGYPGINVEAVCNAMVFSPAITAKIAEALRTSGLPRC